ncbi:hypothetical protein Nepgr_023333 [Nepenthes gracilis]|uniref:Integrase zinc-binding domain-containing protein n=1 Tax=Nepenthes gracilis TaxID=150966 RepID=A0AAD3T2N0_NEPGR|nr:hypothetical protein Nepgr_023333 [Nepenthes gracilis]
MVVDGRLYRRGCSTPYLCYLTPEEADYALGEVHLGICGSHVGGKNLAFKIMRQGYYWPSMKKDALEFVKKCESCQLHGNLHHQPSADLKSLQAPWPFAQWGLDILDPFPSPRVNIIIRRFGVPEVVITDNGTQFLGKRFTKYCTSLGIKLVHISVAYLQANGRWRSRTVRYSTG